MAGGSQLKRLKASLREQGLAGQQKSKKARKDGARPELRAQRGAALASIRDSFNPFEVKAPARPKKMEVTTLNSDKQAKRMIGRPGVTKSMGEENRRKTLLLEVQSRNKAGGIVDRRLGENDENLTVEERALKRFTREKKKGRSAFDLEDDDEEMLTHGGRALNLQKDDFDADDLSGSDDGEDGLRSGKRKRHLDDSDEEMQEEETQLPGKKKSKAEALKDVIAKSKLQKYERQQAKEDDDDVRDELDKGLGDLQDALVSFQRSANKRANGNTVNGAPVMNNDRAALMGASDKDYEKRMREIAMAARSKASDRTKTEKEKAEEEAAKQKEQDRKRAQRMTGEADEDEDDDGSEEEDEDATEQQEVGGLRLDPTDSWPVRDQANGFVAEIPDDAKEFGLSQPRIMDRPPGFEDDEDEFVIEDGLVDSGEEISDEENVNDFDDDASDESGDLPDQLLALQGQQGDSDDDLLDDLENQMGSKTPKAVASKVQTSCPQDLEQLQSAVQGLAHKEIPEFIRTTRIKYEASTATGNKELLQHFSGAIVALLGVSQTLSPTMPLEITEQIIRHVHSLSRTYPLEISTAFRDHLLTMSQRSDIESSDLVILTAIAAIYPTSDHFHQVVTPAITLMARWLGLTTPRTDEHLRTGGFVVALALSYQSLSKRYIPEAIRFSVLALRAKPADISLLEPHISNLRSMIELWSEKSAFREVFTPDAARALHALSRTHSTALSTLRLLANTLTTNLSTRTPLHLHTHKPIAIKSSIPKFEDDFQPGKHYDPDTERFEANKLQKEFKRERKGALRELRKDNSFLARESLRAKKEKDKAYEEKYRRLVASIQGEEGQGANEYEREKKARKGRNKAQR